MVWPGCLLHSLGVQLRGHRLIPLTRAVRIPGRLLYQTFSIYPPFEALIAPVVDPQRTNMIDVLKGGGGSPPPARHEMPQR